MENGSIFLACSRDVACGNLTVLRLKDRAMTLQGDYKQLSDVKSLRMFEANCGHVEARNCASRCRKGVSFGAASAGICSAL